jgi:hypothetical protein
MIRWIGSRMSEAFGYEDCLAEWRRFKLEPPIFTGNPQHPITIEQFCEFWTAQEDMYPALADAVKRFARISPTEAACERSFSVLKFSVSRLRTRSSVDLVCGGRSGAAVAFLSGENFEEEDDDEPAGDDEEPEVEEDPLLPRPLNQTGVKLIVDVWQTISTQRVPREAMRKQRRTEEQTRCGLCDAFFRAAR